MCSFVVTCMFCLINSADHDHAAMAKAINKLKTCYQPSPDSELTSQGMKALQVSKRAGLNIIHMQDQHKMEDKNCHI